MKTFLFLMIMMISANKHNIVCDVTKTMINYPKNWICNNSQQDICSWFIFGCDSSYNITDIYLDRQIEVSGIKYTPKCNKECMKHIMSIPTLKTLNIAGNHEGTLDYLKNGSKELTIINITGSKISGTIPSEIFSIATLEYFTVSKCMLSGFLPHNFFRNINNLTFIDISHNRLMGHISGIHNTKLKHIDLSFNLLLGTIPKDFLFPKNELLTIDISYNGFYGTIPEIKNTKLISFIASHNRLSDSISFIMGGKDPYLLDLSYNFFTENTSISEKYKFNPNLTLLNVDISNNRFNDIPYDLFMGTKSVKLLPQDFDECALGIHSCPEKANCTNGWTPYMSYTCTCEKGYILGSRNGENTCFDIDECNFGACGNNDKCVNTIGGYECCKDGYIAKDLGEKINSTFFPSNIFSVKKCVDINECLIGNNVCSGIDKCKNTNGGYICCKDEEYNYDLNGGDCVFCFGDFKHIKNNNSVFSSLKNYDFDFEYLKCIGECNNGLSISVRESFSPSCKGETLQRLACNRPCIGVDNIKSLQFELFKDNFIRDVIEKIFNVNISLSNKRSIIDIKSIEFIIDDCEKNDDIGLLLFELSKELGPNIPNLEYNINGCQIKIMSAVTNKTVIIIFSLASILFIFGLVLIGIVYYYKTQDNLGHLPKEISWTYYMKNFKWKYRGSDETGYWYRQLNSNTEEYNKILDYIVDKNEISQYINNIVLIYNRTLLDNFINTYLIQQERFKNDKKLFYNKKWTTNNDNTRIYDFYEKLCNNYSWNKDNITVLPVCHGTDLTVAEKICETGFATLSSLDQGWYGKGIYFSSYGMYCSPYFSTKRNPVIVLSWILPGNSYPVIEKPDSQSSIIGTAIKSGYQSHFVAVNQKGQIYDGGQMYNEIVINQESQIVPMAILHIDSSKLDNIVKRWTCL